MVQTRNGKKMRHAGDSNLLHRGKVSSVFAGVGGWKGARRSGCGMRGDRGVKEETMVPQITKSWQNKPGSKRRRRKNRAWRGQSAWNAENFKRDFEREACEDNAELQQYPNVQCI